MIIGMFASELSKSCAAERLHISRATLSKALNAKSGLTAPMALMLRAGLGMQLQWDLRKARKLRLPKIEPIKREATTVN